MTRANAGAAFVGNSVKNFVTGRNFSSGPLFPDLRRKLNMIHDTDDPLKTSTYREDKAFAAFSPPFAGGHLESMRDSTSPWNFSSRLTVNFSSIFRSDCHYRCIFIEWAISTDIKRKKIMNWKLQIWKFIDF